MGLDRAWKGLIFSGLSLRCQMPEKMPRIVTERAVSPRKRIGQLVMSSIPSYRLKGDGLESVTAARNYVRANKITSPALISVVRTEFTTDHFFWSERGMFGAVYAEYNYFNFPSLMEVFRKLREESLVPSSRESIAASVLTEYEVFKPEFAFI